MKVQIDCYGFEAASEHFQKRKLHTFLVKEIDGVVYECFGPGGGGSDEGAPAGYRLVRAVPTDGAVGLRDRCVTRIDVTDGGAPLRLVVPPKTEGVARDFFVRLVVTSDGIPEITFAAPTGEALPFAPKPPPPVVPEPPQDVPGAVPVIGKLVAEGANMPKITNEQQLKDFIRGLTLDAKFGNAHEDAKEPDAIGKERQTYTYRGIVFRTERRKIHELYDLNTMQQGFTSQKDLSVQNNRTEAMGLGVKGKNEKDEEILCGPGATGKSGVSCAKTIGGVIGYVGGGHTFYVIDTTKIPPNEKAWDMENTILKNGLLKTDESNGEVNVSYIPKKAIIGHVYVPAQSKIDDQTDTDKRWSTVRNIATGSKYVNLKIEFNPEYEP